jgi:hypothetical protein
MIAENAVMMVGNALKSIAIALGIIQIHTEEGVAGATAVKTLQMGRSLRVLRWIIGATKVDIFWTRVSTAVTRLWSAAAWGSVGAANGQFVSLTRVEIMLIRARRAMILWTLAIRAAVVEMIVFLFTNPIGWAILLIAALALLYWRWERFRNAVNRMAFWMRDSWNHFDFSGPFKWVAVTIWGLHRIYDLLVKIKNLQQGKTPSGRGIGGSLPIWMAKMALQSQIPGLAGGGFVTGGGVFQVGEHGPEHVVLPKGSAVSPIGGRAAAFDKPFEIHVHTELNVDGKKMAEVVSRHRLDSTARR